MFIDHELNLQTNNKNKKKLKKHNAETRDSSELKWALRILNQGPLDLQSNALPTELFRQIRTISTGTQLCA